MFANRLKQRQELTESDLMRRAPSIFATAPQVSRVSDKYEFIPTTKVIQLLNKEGWTPVAADQSRVKTSEGKDFAKHVITFQNKSIKTIGEDIPELILTNSHNGLSAFNIMAGLYRLVCSNGLMAFSPSFGSYSIKHVGFKSDEVIEASYKIIEQVPLLASSIGEMKSLELTKPEQEAFAKAALEIRWEDGKAPLTPEQILLTRRYDDRKDNLWTTFNAVQENMIKGGLRGRTVNETTGRVRRARTRAITSVNENVRVNKALWTLADEMKKLKTS